MIATLSIIDTQAIDLFDKARLKQNRRTLSLNVCLE